MVRAKLALAKPNRAQETLGSSLDMEPTLLGRLGLSYDSFTPGREARDVQRPRIRRRFAPRLHRRRRPVKCSMRMSITICRLHIER